MRLLTGPDPTEGEPWLSFSFIFCAFFSYAFVKAAHELPLIIELDRGKQKQKQRLSKVHGPHSCFN